MRLLTALLALASLTLPAAHRARWREEAAALLIEVHGARRWWFVVDTVVKVPALAWCYRVLEPPLPTPARAVTTLTGAALIAMPVLAVAAILFAPALGEPTAEFLFLLSPCGLFGFVAVRTFRGARHRGGGFRRYTVAALVTAFAGTGPVVAGALSVALDMPVIAVLGAVLPGAWLVAVNATVLARRSCPRPLGLFGIAAGLGLTGVLLGVQLTPYLEAAAAATAFSLLVLIPSCLVWSTWTGVRLLRGQARQLV